MKIKIRPLCISAALILLALGLCLWSAPGVFAQGGLNPPGPPGAGMVTLQQIEPRTPISSAPFTIMASGSYYLTTNITVSTGIAIFITASGVTLDLNGFTISSTAASANHTGILLGNSVSEISVFNGHIVSGVTQNNGYYSGGGFAYGITGNSGAPPYNVRVRNVSVIGCLDDGIDLFLGNATAVESCTVNTAGGAGIEADSVANSVAFGCGTYGVAATTVHNCAGASYNGYGIYALGSAENSCGASSGPVNSGVYAYTAQNCYGANNANGYGLLANGDAVNCYGTSATGTGLLANHNAQNCYGTSGGSGGPGLIANNNAENCTGISSGSGDGLDANNGAENCTGSSGTGYGIYANNAHNCNGFSTGNDGIHAVATAESCSGGTASGGSGVYAFTAQNCYGTNALNYGIYVSGNAINCTGFGGFDGLHANATAENCYGASTNSGGSGVYAIAAQNCYGINSGDGNGVYAGAIASGCYGSSGGKGYGLTAGDPTSGLGGGNAQNCYGSSVSGGGLNANQNAENCYGFSHGGTGLYAGLATSCTGITDTPAGGSGPWGLQAQDANFCFGGLANTRGDTFVFFSSFNMP
jgi:hypothetical protein